MKYYWYFLLISGLISCKERSSFANQEIIIQHTHLVILGNAQDAGYPQAGCDQNCCTSVWGHPERQRMVTSLGLLDPVSKRYWLLDATPDFPAQLRRLEDLMPEGKFAGIFLTHAHIGHYTGLMYLGREAMGGQQIPVYAMPRMAQFLQSQGPWSQLVALGQIEIRPLRSDSIVQLSPGLGLRPLQVPHRDEFSETVGFVIETPAKAALFIPDIDKWEKWETPIDSLIQAHDLAFLDGTFFAEGELPGRNMAEIPHPFVTESMARFASLADSVRSRIHFIHFNHTNPLLRADHPARAQVNAAGFHVAKQGDVWPL